MFLEEGPALIISGGGRNRLTVIKFPKKEFILRCHKCRESNAFYIILGSENWADIKGIECAGCGAYTELLEEEKAKVK